MDIVEIKGIKINSKLFSFVNEQIMPGTGLKSDVFWNNFAIAVEELAKKNKLLLKKRDEIQKKIDNWHKDNKDIKNNKEKYISFLKSINYIVKSTWSRKFQLVHKICIYH